MSTTIDTLDIQIQSSAGNSASNIDNLAAALQRLKGASSLTKVTNNLSKLSTALGELKTASSGLSSLESLATTMSALSGIQKMTGLNSAINALKKLPEVIRSLSTETISAFTTKMKALADALGPLAERINEVGRGFAKLPSQVSKTVTATNRMADASEKAAAAQKEHNHGLNTGSINMAAFISNAQAAIQSVEWLTTAITGYISSAIEWDGIQFRFGRAFGEDAQQVYDWAQRINETLHISTQEFMQYAGVYASLLKGFGLEQQKVTAISVGLTELSYDIWAANNDRYKTLEDASEAVRSAITGEIEPIRNAGIALTEASMQEYLDGLGLAHVRMANLSESQKAQVRYAVMVNSAMNQGIVGTYAQEMKTAEGAVRTLTQQTKSLKQAFGSLFIPILSAVLPYLSAFVSLLYDAVAAVAAFFSIPFFKIDWSGTSSGMGAVADNAAATEKSLGGAGGAAKKLKDYLMGFDELNVIKPDTGGGGGGGAAGAGSDWEGLDVESLWDESILAKASRQVDEVKAKIKAWLEEWKTELAIISAAMAALGITGLLTNLGEAYDLGDKFLGVMGKIRKFATSAIIITLGFALMKSAFGDFMGEDGKLWDYIKGLLIGGAASWVLYSMWGPAGLAIGFGVMAAASLSAVIENGGINSVESATVGLTGLAAAFTSVGIVWKKVVPILKTSGLAEYFKAVKQNTPEVGLLAAAFPKLSGAMASVVGWFSKAAGAVSTFFAGLSAGVIAGAIAIIVALASAVYFVAENWDKVKLAVQGFFETNIEPKLEKIKEHWENIKESLKPLAPLFEKVRKKLEPLIKKVQNFFKKIDVESVLSGIGKAFEVLGGIVFAILTGPIAGAFSSVMTVIEGFVQTISGIIQVVSGVVSFVVAIFKGDWQKAWQSVKDIGKGIQDTFEGLWTMVVKPVEEFVNGVIDWFTELYDELVGHSIVPDMIDEIVDWFKGLPGKVLESLGNFVKDVIKKFEKMWSDLQTWWNNKPPLSEYVPVIGSIQKKVSEAWDAAKKWYEEKKAKLLEYTPSIGSIKEKLTAAWNAAKQWYEDKKAKLKEYTPDIGSIKDKLVSAWNTAKQWYENAKAKLATYTPDIGSIRDKLHNAWTTARNWWHNSKAALASYTPSIGSIRDKLHGAWTVAKNWWDKSKAALASYTPSIGSIKDRLVSAWNTAKSWWDRNVRLSIPSLSFQVTYTSKSQLGAIKKAIVNALGLPGWPRLSFAAGGGIFDQGSLVWAGEAGPEIVANASGGKTGVMNVDQMQAAVYEGVYTAVAAAMARNSGGGSAPVEVKVYLDGKQITAAVEKNQKERGMAFMGTQVYAY